MTDERPLTDLEVAVRLGVQPTTLRAWRRQGRGPAYMKLGKAVRYTPEDVDAWKRAMRIDLTPQ